MKQSRAIACILAAISDVHFYTYNFLPLPPFVIVCTMFIAKYVIWHWLLSLIAYIELPALWVWPEVSGLGLKPQDSGFNAEICTLQQKYCIFQFSLPVSVITWYNTLADSIPTDLSLSSQSITTCLYYLYHNNSNKCYNSNSDWRC